ncbi:hypothetical protein PIB30_008747 [Stylosanthes scabra]|uniref:Uncharacterized protein n=1 Tax=Stylosanthes scabra TaxID=79078 RepID=A0ABU6V3V3_9FABA|nr:hypothetical protein [Stylosanthes scabra]
MRHTLASVILRLLGSRVVHDADYLANCSPLRKEVESPFEAASVDGLFDRLLLILHGLFNSCLPSWLRWKPSSKTANEPTREFCGSDQELIGTLQNDLERMQLPDTIRCRIQAVMPVLVPSTRRSFSCQPPSVPASALVSLQPSKTNSGSNSRNSTVSRKNLVPSSRTAASVVKSKQQDHDLDIDPWTLLEDGAGSCSSTNNSAIMGSGDCVNIQAGSWLKGAVRVRRRDLTYIDP